LFCWNVRVLQRPQGTQRVATWFFDNRPAGSDHFGKTLINEHERERNAMVLHGRLTLR
jgi:hypothetical protein